MILNCHYDRPDSSEEEEDDVDDGKGDLVDSPEQDFLDSWMERASSFNNVCKRYSKLCDKFTFIENRELFFDANGYLSNLQVILSACNRYLKWVGLDRCRKPITGGPTLSGLPGGVAGDLQRLFPVKSNFEYPMRTVRSPSSFQIQPVERREFTELAEEKFPRLYCDILSVEETDLPGSIGRFLSTTKVTAFTGNNGKVLCVDCDDEALAGIVAGSNNVKDVIKAMQEAFSEARSQNLNASSLPVTLPSSKDNDDDVLWQKLDKFDAVISLTMLPELLFSRTAANATRLLLMLLGDPEKACCVVEKSAPLTKRFLMKKAGFKGVVYAGQRFSVLAYAKEEDDDVDSDRMED